MFFFQKFITTYFILESINKGFIIMKITLKVIGNFICI